MIIDTSIWIPALRRDASAEKEEVARLIRTEQAAIVGIVLVEILRGARSMEHFEELGDQLLAAEYLEDNEETWMTASEILLNLKLQGQTIPLPDAVIAAHAIVGTHSVYARDEHFTRVAGLRLYEAPQ